MSGIEAEIGHFGVADNAFAQISRGGVDLVPDGIMLDFSALADFKNLPIGGHFVVECWRPDGSLAWEDTAENGVTDAGIASLLNVYLRNQTQKAAWYIGIVDNAGFVAFASGDVATSHAGWSEIASTNFSDTARVQWNPAAPSGGAVVNTTTSDYHMIGVALTAKGLFLISDSTKGGTAGLIFSTAAFTAGTQAVNPGDTLKVTYTVAATSA